MSRSRPTARSDREPGAAGPRDSAAEGLEQQQQALLSALRRAQGAPLSYQRLQDLGIEFPASVVSELELAGVDLDRCHVGGEGGVPVMGVRLDPARDPVRGAGQDEQAPPLPRASDEAAPSAEEPRTGEPESSRPRRTPTPGGRPLVLALAAILVVAVVAAVVLVSRDGGHHGPPASLVTGSTGDQGPTSAGHHGASPTGVSGRTPSDARAAGSGSVAAGGTGAAAHRPSAHRPAARRGARGRGHQVASPVRPSAATPVSPVLAHSLDVQGHELLDAGSYPAAIRVLSRTLQATGESTQECLDPVSESCLIYAYALYDLGRALQLSGHPAAAVPYLERRLRIDNQRPVVADELAQARGEVR